MKRKPIESFDNLKNGDLIISPIDNEVTPLRGKMEINILQTKLPCTSYTNLMKKTSIFMRVQKR